MNNIMKRFCLVCALLCGLLALAGCAKKLDGTYNPVETEKPGLLDRFRAARPALKFNPTHVRLERSGSDTVIEYEYKIVDGAVEVVMPSDGKREIWRLVIEKDGSLSSEGKIWKKAE